MPDYDSIPLDDNDHPSSDDAPSNRPADGARQATPSEMESDSWSASDEGGDFLGLEADLVGGTPAPDPNAQFPPTELQLSDEAHATPGYDTAAYDHGGAGLDVADTGAGDTAYSPSFAAEADAAEAGGSPYAEDVPGFEDEYEDEYEQQEEFAPLQNRSRSGVWITVGLALGMGAAAVVAMDYFGLAERTPTTEVATSTAPRGTSVRPVPTPVDVAPTETATLDPVTPSVPTWSEDATETPAFEDGQDPLLDKLLTGEELTQVEASGFEANDPDATSTAGSDTFGDPVDLTAFDGDTSPIGTVAAWFAPDPPAGTETTPNTNVAATETPATTQGGGATQPTGEETHLTDAGPTGPVGPDTPAADTLADPLADAAAAGSEAGASDTIVERSGLAVFDELTFGSDVPRSRAADDLAKMDVVWRGEEVPFDMIASVAKIWTPQVGRVRVTTRRGEVFEGRLTAVGKRRVWLGGEFGEMALDGDTVGQVERMPDHVRTDAPGDLASATGKRVKATSPGGTFEGMVLSVSGSQVTIVTDSGGRITLNEPTIEPVREGIRVKVKSE